MYVHANKLIMEEEQNKLNFEAINTDQAVYFLPDYLRQEAEQQGGQEMSDNLVEFRPAILYTEQMMRIFPREIAVRFKLMPAFEETLMRW